MEKGRDQEPFRGAGRGVWFIWFFGLFSLFGSLGLGHEINQTNERNCPEAALTAPSNTSTQ
jgi:hypothetical protein